MTTPEVLPEGFAPHFRKSPLTDPWEPIYSQRLDDRVVIGLYVRQPHTNSRGMVHGGLVAALADNAMGLSCGQVLLAEGRKPEGGLVTVSMAIDFIGAAKLGQWVAFDTQYVKAGKTLCFAQAFITADGQVIGRADARFKLT
ncbi:MAG TPA: PaaI family thioesterase [Hyphomonadaceae bacterium]|nr:PaaI family thioesterase [Hyphomonadaceae bacterium]HPN04497.1 PaaI family thioesterase [Hyphomonadaceae bacterium]